MSFMNDHLAVVSTFPGGLVIVDRMGGKLDGLVGQKERARVRA